MQPVTEAGRLVNNNFLLWRFFRTVSYCVRVQHLLDVGG